MTQVSFGRVDSSRTGMSEDASEGNTRIDDQRVSDFFGAKQDWTFRGSDRCLFKWGFDARLLDAEYNYTSHTEITDPLFTPTGSPTIVDRRINTQPTGSRLAAYAAARAKLLRVVTAELGLRWDRQTYSGDSQLDPRVNVVWAAGERSTVRAAWGLFHQSQRIDELQVEDGMRDFFPAQRSEHRLISFEHEAGAGFRFRVDAYWKAISSIRPRFENLFDPLALLPEGESDRVMISPRRATTKGVEAFLRGEPSTAISWWAGYTLASAEDDIDGRSEPRSWDQTHAVNLGLGYRFRPGWELDLAGVWHSGWPTTRVDASAVTDPNGIVTVVPTLGPRNDESFPPYHRLDMKLTRRIQLEDSTLTLFLEVLNLYDRKNVCCVDDFRYHPDASGDVRVERHEDFWLERLPSFGISWTF